MIVIVVVARSLLRRSVPLCTGGVRALLAIGPAVGVGLGLGAGFDRSREQLLQVPVLVAITRQHVRGVQKAVAPLAEIDERGADGRLDVDHAAAVDVVDVGDVLLDRHLEVDDAPLLDHGHALLLGVPRVDQDHPLLVRFAAPRGLVLVVEVVLVIGRDLLRHGAVRGLAHQHGVIGQLGQFGEFVIVSRNDLDLHRSKRLLVPAPASAARTALASSGRVPAARGTPGAPGARLVQTLGLEPGVLVVDRHGLGRQAGESSRSRLLFSALTAAIATTAPAAATAALLAWRRALAGERRIRRRRLRDACVRLALHVTVRVERLCCLGAFLARLARRLAGRGDLSRRVTPAATTSTSAAPAPRPAVLAGRQSHSGRSVAVLEDGIADGITAGCTLTGAFIGRVGGRRLELSVRELLAHEFSKRVGTRGQRQATSSRRSATIRRERRRSTAGSIPGARRQVCST